MGSLWPHISNVSIYRIGVLWRKDVKNLVLHTYHVHTSVTNNEKYVLEALQMADCFQKKLGTLLLAYIFMLLTFGGNHVSRKKSVFYVHPPTNNT